MSTEQQAVLSDNPTADQAALAALEAHAAKNAPEADQSLADSAAAAAEAEAAEAEQAPSDEGDAPSKDEGTGAIDYAKYTAEITEGGALSEESYAELEAKGFSRAMVDTYVRGLQATADTLTTQVISEVGGQEVFGAAAKWAESNLSEADLAAYNAAVTNQFTAKAAVEGLIARYHAAEGKAPAVTVKGAAPKASISGFENSNQVVEAMRDPRYRNDSAYRAEVQQRLARSSLF